MDRVFIEGLRVDCVIGLYDWERKVRQTVRLDLEMGFENRRAAATDELADTLDYKAIGKRLQAFIEASDFNLVESLAEACAAIVLDEFGAQWLKLRLAKPGALRGAESVGIEIERGHRT